jgi:alanine racemase
MPTLEINLSSLKQNFNTLKNLCAPAMCSAVVKANAYGLGVRPVVHALSEEGCSFFWVAHAKEALIVRDNLPQSDVAVLQGFNQETLSFFAGHQLIPVLSTVDQVTLFKKNQSILKDPIIQVNTGLNRLGLTDDNLSCLDGLSIRLIMSHLACADAQSHFMNDAQLEKFKKLRSAFPETPFSLSASDAVFLGKQFHFDLVRAGAALYGVNTTPYRENVMAPVITLKAPILQLSELKAGSYVGYGATYRTYKSKRVATVSIGYNDGFPRALSDKGRFWFDHYEAPVIGRVSMDMVTCDISRIPESFLKEGTYLTAINDFYTVDDFARDSNTIGYEVLCGLGDRLKCVYI